MDSSIENSSFIPKICGFSRGIKCSKNPIQETSKKPQLILDPIGCEKSCGKNHMGLHKHDLDGAYEDHNRALEFSKTNFGVFINEYMKPRFSEQRLMNLIDEFQLVNLNKKKVIEKDLLFNCGSCDMGANSSLVKVVSMDDDDKAIGSQRVKMSFHLPSIPKPQDVYRIVVNNVNQPFEHVWLEMSGDRSRFIHPLEKLSVFNFVDKYVSKMEPAKPLPVETTTFKLVEDVKDLKYLVSRLQRVDEFAVDLEHNQYRSYQGITCLMQISTRTEDFIIDTFKLRIQIGPYLRELFRDPTKRKVMHGADKDVLWLQRDFGIYICNMFDTGQASRALKMERNSLEYSLRYFCGVSLNKEYQTADWRLRPLTDEMLRYAREDTHYLLYLYDLMKIKLVSSSPDPNRPEALLVEVYRRSYDVCLQMYQKEIVTEDSYLNIYGLHSVDLNGQQLAVVAGLCEWRDVVARATDESTGYVLPNKSLIELAKWMPVSIEELRHLLKFRHPFIERNLSSVLSIIQSSMQNAAMFEDVANRLKAQRLEMDSGTNIQVKSKPSFGHDELIGNSAGNRKFDPDKKVKFVQVFGNESCNIRSLQFGLKAIEETKLEQMMSPTFNLPFPYRMAKPNPQVPAMKQPAKAQETSNRKETVASVLKPKHDVVLLNSGFCTLENKRGSVVHSRARDRDENIVIPLDPNLNSNGACHRSPSFQKCLQTKIGKRFSGDHKDSPDGGVEFGTFSMNRNTSVAFRC